jgi:hypothetical protein
VGAAEKLSTMEAGSSKAGAKNKKQEMLKKAVYVGVSITG